MNDIVTVPAPYGILDGISNEEYHAGPGISKSGLWTLYDKTPAHFKYGERKAKNAFDVGEAIHLAVLQPDVFETRVIRGPADRRGNNWKEFQAEAVSSKRLLLTSGDFDEALEVRDSVHADSWINRMIVSTHSMVEYSGYWIDPETGVLCRCRPDLYRPDLGIMFDLKTTRSAAEEAFTRDVGNYGYHAQEAFYGDGFRALGARVDAFVFIALEKDTPYCRAVYDIEPAFVEEGRQIMRRALKTYNQCQTYNIWPGYPAEVMTLSPKKWAYRETEAPVGGHEE